MVNLFFPLTALIWHSTAAADAVHRHGAGVAVNHWENCCAPECLENVLEHGPVRGPVGGTPEHFLDLGVT